jgi:hypothetical protein
MLASTIGPGLAVLVDARTSAVPVACLANLGS